MVCLKDEKNEQEGKSQTKPCFLWALKGPLLSPITYLQLIPSINALLMLRRVKKFDSYLAKLKHCINSSVALVTQLNSTQLVRFISSLHRFITPHDKRHT